ncbi:hypothetical protein Salat_1852100 [Sesamum alatum]|uniref:Uncharacterized protein n=1 Tax=Sesamum alatum TaxID=300844 RepID=A0AAE1Y2R3_9LAMI|nr:hypothetical protein Salat_1852100 [Sesamum alatum]
MSVAFVGKFTDYRLNVLVTQGSYCSTFEWVDQPGCQRCVEVILGLIWRLSRSTANEKAYEDRIRKLEAHVRSLRARLYVVLIAIVVTEFNTCLLQKVFFYCKHFTKPMDRCFIRELVRKVEFGCIENGEPTVIAIEGAEKPFARAYRWDTEPAWEELKIIFGKPVDEPIHKSDDEVYPDTQNNPEEIVVRVPSDHNA